MFVVAGITGNTGAAAADALLARGQSVRALVRNKAKAAPWAAKGVALVEADLLDAAALAEALKGAEGAYLLVPPDLGHPDPIDYYEAVARTVRDAATAAGLRKLVFLSSEGAHLPSGTGPIRGMHQAEDILRGAVPQLTFLRATYFQENWQAVLGLAAEQGVMPTMLADVAAKRTMVAARDIGRAAADLLLDPDAPAIVELSGPEPYAAADAASAMSAALGRPVAAVQPPRDQWVPILTGAGLGRAYAELIAEMYDGINSGHVRFSGEGRAMRGETTLPETIRSWSRAAAA